PSFFFLRPPPPPQLYTLSLHDALPICCRHRIPRSRREVDNEEGVDRVRELVTPDGAVQHGARLGPPRPAHEGKDEGSWPPIARQDRKSTRLNSSHDQISYAVFCLKKKK